jgi:hypothetical protein
MNIAMDGGNTSHATAHPQGAAVLAALEHSAPRGPRQVALASWEDDDGLWWILWRARDGGEWIEKFRVVIEYEG